MKDKKPKTPVAPKTPAAPDTKDAKILGTKENPVVKTFDITDFKATEEDGLVVIRGYGNTKGNKDRYGDIPTVFPSVRNYVYELTEFLKNPVMLLDHSNQVSHIAGSFPEIVEDEVGLRFKAVFSNSDLPEIKHARTVFLEGHARAFSIAGRWHYEDKENPDHLTYAEIYHISPVGVGADPNALGDATLETPEPKATDEEGKVPPWKYCVCTGKDCGYWTPKEAGVACAATKCPECGGLMTGSNTKPKIYAVPAAKDENEEKLKSCLKELSEIVGSDKMKEQLKQRILELKKLIEA